MFSRIGTSELILLLSKNLRRASVLSLRIPRIITKKKINLLRNLLISAKISCKTYYKNAHISY